MLKYNLETKLYMWHKIKEVQTHRKHTYICYFRNQFIHAVICKSVISFSYNHINSAISNLSFHLTYKCVSFLSLFQYLFALLSLAQNIFIARYIYCTLKLATKKHSRLYKYVYANLNIKYFRNELFGVRLTVRY